MKVKMFHFNSKLHSLQRQQFGSILDTILVVIIIIVMAEIRDRERERQE